MILDLSKSAYEDLNNFNDKERKYILKKLEYFSKNYEELKHSKNVTAIVDYSNLYRYKIKGNLRALYTIKNNKIEILVLRISHRKDIYDKLNSL